MSFLLLYLGEGRTFDADHIRRLLTELPCEYLREAGGEKTIHCEYALNDDVTTIRLAPDRETVIIEGQGEASLEAAVAIQKHYPEAIHLIDEGYAFDINLWDIKTVHELRRLL